MKKKINEKKIASLVRSLLIELGEDPDREGLVKTPERVAKAVGLSSKARAFARMPPVRA
jgi:GTP cyclohydrolase I